MQNAGPSIVFVEQFYYPDGWGGAELPRDLTRHLAGRGYAVEVICGSDPYAPVDGDRGPDPAEDGVLVRRIPRLFGGDIHRFKLLRQLWFCAVLLPLLLFRRRPSLYVSQTNPPLAVPLVAVAATLRRRPYVLIAMDVYPEVLEVHGAVRTHGLRSRVLSAVFNRAYRAALRVVALGPVMRDRLLAKGVDQGRLVEISNWSTGADGVVRGAANRLRTHWDLQDKFVLVYSGNLGAGHEFETLLHGFAAAVKQVTAARLVVIGRGGRLGEVRRMTRELGLEAVVRFSDFVPAEQLPESMGMADLAIVTLRQGFEGLIVPSKLLGCMSRGIPVLYIGPPSDVDQFLAQYQCGIALRNGDVGGVCTAIVNASRDPGVLASMGEAGRRGYAADLCREAALARYEAVFADCLRAGGERPS
jgi:colanic acid biosynthesis glycosyl transferase WcaI